MSPIRWRRQGLVLPTTLAGAELCGLVAFVGLRLVDLVQLAVAAPGGLENATRPAVDASLMILFVMESVVIIRVVVRARRYLSLKLATMDTTMALIVLAAQPVFTAQVDRVGTWTAWGFAVSVGTALGIGIGFPRAWQTWAAATALAVAYLVVSLPDPSSGAHSSAWSNAVAYFGFALIARGLAGYLRRMGRDADTARATAERLGREREFERHRHLLHDQATVLGLVSREQIDGALGGALREQAGRAALEIRAFLGRSVDETQAASAGSDRHLVETIREVAATFGDLPIDLSMDLANAVVLPDKTAQALRGAVSAVLNNVRVHARASHIVVHADAEPASGVWEVVVRDDGVGFDPGTTAPGFGLARQLVAALAEVGVTALVEAAPGEGTLVTMHGALTTATKEIA